MRIAEADGVEVCDVADPEGAGQEDLGAACDRGAEGGVGRELASLRAVAIARRSGTRTRWRDCRQARRGPRATGCGRAEAGGAARRRPGCLPVAVGLGRRRSGIRSRRSGRAAPASGGPVICRWVSPALTAWVFERRLPGVGHDVHADAFAGLRIDRHGLARLDLEGHGDAVGLSDVLQVGDHPRAAEDRDVGFGAVQAVDRIGVAAVGSFTTSMVNSGLIALPSAAFGGQGRKMRNRPRVEQQRVRGPSTLRQARAVGAVDRREHRVLAARSPPSARGSVSTEMLMPSAGW